MIDLPELDLPGQQTPPELLQARAREASRLLAGGSFTTLTVLMEVCDLQERHDLATDTNIDTERPEWDVIHHCITLAEYLITQAQAITHTPQSLQTWLNQSLSDNLKILSLATQQSHRQLRLRGYRHPMLDRSCQMANILILHQLFKLMNFPNNWLTRGLARLIALTCRPL